jgi:hypothetical protein
VDDRENIRSTSSEDIAIESAVLQHVLALHPATLTREEIALEIGEPGESFAGRDAVERALHDLAAAGLLHLSDSLVLPSRAALRFDQLLGGE